MQRFAGGEIQLLVATTVIEVGVDVPEREPDGDRERRAHGTRAAAPAARPRRPRRAREQLRAAVSRAAVGDGARAARSHARDQRRLRIARRDLELRGPGELLGRRQTGLAQLRVADLARDADLLDEVRAAAAQMLQAMPERVAALRARWIGEREQYGRVG